MREITISVDDENLAILRGVDQSRTEDLVFEDPVQCAIAIAKLDPYKTFGCGPLYDAAGGAYGSINRFARGIATTNDHVDEAFTEGLIEAEYGPRYSWDPATIDISLYSRLPRVQINEALEAATQEAAKLGIGSNIMFCGNAAGQLQGPPQVVHGTIWLHVDGDFYAYTDDRTMLGGTSGSGVRTYPEGWNDFSHAGRFEAAMHPESKMVGVQHSSANHFDDTGRLRGAGVFQPITDAIRV